METRTRLRIRYEDLEAALGGSSDPEAIWQQLEKRATNPFDGRRLLMWFGGTLALIASTIFLGTAGVSFGAAGFVASLVVVMAGLIGGGWILKQREYHFAGGMLATLFVGLVPLLIFAIANLLGVDAEFAEYSSFYDYISDQWVWMELATIAAGVFVAWKFDFGFASLPPAIALYFFVMDLGDGLLNIGFETLGVLLGLLFGAAMVAIAWRFELSGKSAHATWLLLFGLLSILYGVGQTIDLVGSGSVLNDSVAASIVYTVVGLAYLVLGWVMKRGIPLTIGGVVIACSLSYLTFDFFDGSIFFSLAVFAIGIAIVVAASLVGRNERKTIRGDYGSPRTPRDPQLL